MKKTAITGTKHPKCNSSHRIDVDDVMENLTEVLRKIAQYSLANKEEFEALVKKAVLSESRQTRKEIEEAKKEKSRAYHREYSKEYRFCIRHFCSFPIYFYERLEVSRKSDSEKNALKVV